MTKNPWNVSDSSLFLKYCCPECDFQCPHLYNFEEHALGTHELSKILFENNSVKEEETSSDIFEPTIHLKEDLENVDQELVKKEYYNGKLDLTLRAQLKVSKSQKIFFFLEPVCCKK